MTFLRRLLGQGEGSEPDDDEPSATEPAEVEEAEHELELLREEQARHDELTERQLRYAHYAWQPPAQGGERRADDKDQGTT
jgi:hypothetical protein